MHTVADLLCMGCQQLGKKTTVGWMYLHAKERDQRYKEGKSFFRGSEADGVD